MRPANPNEQYEAVLYTAKGVHTLDHFDDLDRAKSWILKEYEQLDGESAVAIFDRRQDNKRIFVIDRWFLLPK
jgi:predicted ATPase